MPSLLAPIIKTFRPSSFVLKPLAFNLQPILDHLIELILILAIGVTPLLFSPAFGELFEFPKMVFVYALSILSLPLIAAKLLHRRHLNLPRTPLDVPLGLYIFVFLAATAFSIDTYTSIMGYYSRFTGGLASLIAYLVLFYLTLLYLANPEDEARSSNVETQNKFEKQNSRIFRFGISDLFRMSDFGFQISNQKVKPLLTAWLFSATIVSIYAILEHFGHDPSCLILRGSFTADCWIQDVSARAFATFGQPNWLACYLITAIPIAFVQLLSSTSNRHRAALSGSLVLMYAAWWFTYSRAGWFGLATVLLILSLSLPLHLVLKYRWWLAGILIACLVITATNFNLAASRIGTSLESGADDSSTGQIRLLVWQGTVDVIAHHPLLGTGPETFAYSFLPYRPRAMNDTTEWNFLYNKAHNEVLQTAATTGILGLLTWIGLFVSVGFYLWRQGIFINLLQLKTRNPNIETRDNPEAPDLKLLRFRISDLFRISTYGFRVSNNPHHPTPYNLIQSALFAGLIGVFVAQLLGFAVVVTSLFFWLALAIIVAPSIRIQSIRFPAARIPIFVPIALLTASCFLLAAFGLYRYTSAEIAATDAQSESSASSVIKNQQAVHLNPLEPTYHKNLALAYESLSALDQGANHQWINYADQQAQTAYRLNPHDQIIIKQLAYMYQQLALMDSSFQNKALQMTKAALDLSPTDASAAENLADLQLQYHQKDAALKTYDQLVKLRPAPESYLHRAQWFQKYGSQDQYRAELEQVLKLDPNNKDAQSALELLQTKTLPGDE